MLKLIGWLLVIGTCAVPFLAMFIIDWRKSLAVWAAIAVFFGLLAFGKYLIERG